MSVLGQVLYHSSKCGVRASAIALPSRSAEYPNPSRTISTTGVFFTVASKQKAEGGKQKAVGSRQKAGKTNEDSKIEKCKLKAAYPYARLPSRASAILPSAFCFLPSAFCFLPSAFCLVATAPSRSPESSDRSQALPLARIERSPSRSCQKGIC